jgi:hypothetical protein
VQALLAAIAGREGRTQQGLLASLAYLCFPFVFLQH